MILWELKRFVIPLGLLAFCGCSPDSKMADTAHEKPAKVEKLPAETELATVTLTDDATRRLGIETVAVSIQRVAPKRTLGGEALVPVGRTIVVSTPVAGVVTTSKIKSLPLPGTHVKAGADVLSLVPLLSPERDVPTPAEQVQMVGAQANLVATQTVAMGDIERSKSEVEAARIILDRSKKLFQDRAGARRAVDDAEAQLNIAESVLAAAQQREKQLAALLDSLQRSPSANLADSATALSIQAPIHGMVNRLNVSDGQTVATGTVLFEVVNLDTIWIRVPVFVDLLPTIERQQIAYLVALSGYASAAAKTEAHPIAAPPTANALASSVDLYYEVDNRELKLSPGQRVGVELPLKGTNEAKLVPETAVIYDIYGGAWVYVDSDHRHYSRHRIAVRWIADGQAILEFGPPVGSQVVTAGAAELFGTEFGVGK